MADGEPVLEPFEDEVRERDDIWRNPDNVPRMEQRRHRDGTSTKVMVRSEKGEDRDHAVTVKFTAAEWSLIERAVLAGLGLGRIE